MAYKLQLKRGLTSALPTGSAGEPLFTTDTNDLYIGTGAANQRYQKYIASGSSSQFLKGDGSLDSNTYYLASNPSAYIALTALTASSPLSYNNTTGAFTIAQASGSANGYLSSTDWTTFNNKQNALTNPVTGTGTTNYLSKWTSGSALGNSIIQDNGSAIGIGISSFIGGYKLEVSGLQRNFGANNELRFGELDANNNYFQGVNEAGTVGKGFVFFGTSEYMRITPTGLIGIGTTSPLYKLDVVAGNNDGVVYRTSTRSIGIGQISSEASLFWGSTTPLTFFSGSERMRIDTSGNLGLGVVPSAWGSSTAMQVGSWAALSSANAYGTGLGFNTYYNGTNHIYSFTNNATMLQLGVDFKFLTAAYGTAGNAISFTQAMTLNASGNLLLGTTTDNNKFDLQVANKTSITTTGSAINVNYDGSTTNQYQTIGFSWGSSIGNRNSYWGMGFTGTNYSSGTGDLFLFTNATERLRITSGGSVGLGTTAPDVFGRGYSGTIYGISSGGQSAIELNSATGNGAYFDMGVNGSRTLGIYSDTTNSEIATIGSRDLLLSTNATPRITIKSGGVINIANVPSSATGLSSGDIYKDASGFLKIV